MSWMIPNEETAGSAVRVGDNMKSSPCKDCQRRYLGCHSECKDYIEYSEERQKFLKEKSDNYDILYDNEIVRKKEKAWAKKLREEHK